jgi:hypothetical protein
MFAFAWHGEMRNLPLAILLTMFSFSHLNQSIFLHVTWENLFASSFHWEMHQESPLAIIFAHSLLAFASGLSHTKLLCLGRMTFEFTLELIIFFHNWVFFEKSCHLQT